MLHFNIVIFYRTTSILFLFFLWYILIQGSDHFWQCMGYYCETYSTFFLYLCICSIISLYYTSFGKINETFCRRLFIRKKLNNTIFEKTFTTFFRHIGKLCVFFSIILIILCYTLSLYIYNVPKQFHYKSS